MVVLKLGEIKKHIQNILQAIVVNQIDNKMVKLKNKLACHNDANTLKKHQIKNTLDDLHQNCVVVLLHKV